MADAHGGGGDGGGLLSGTFLPPAAEVDFELFGGGLRARAALAGVVWGDQGVECDGGGGGAFLGGLVYGAGGADDHGQASQQVGGFDRRGGDGGVGVHCWVCLRVWIGAATGDHFGVSGGGFPVDEQALRRPWGQAVGDYLLRDAGGFCGVCVDSGDTGWGAGAADGE